jgi:GGDEF domain-containing protein
MSHNTGKLPIPKPDHLELVNGQAVSGRTSVPRVLRLVQSPARADLAEKRAEAALKLAKLAEEQAEAVQEMAKYDRLTGLYEKTYFMDMLEEKIRTGKNVAVALLDMDKFKKVNDTYGHAEGDRLLKDFSAFFNGHFQREGDAITHEGLHRPLRERDSEFFMARFGGDEFAIMEELNDEEKGPPEAHYRSVDPSVQIGNFRAYIMHTVAEFVDLQPENIRKLDYNVTVGVAHNASGYLTAAEMLHDADVDMYSRKPAGR